MPDFIERPRYYCALGGALGTITALPQAIPVLHAASGCAGNIAWAQNGGCGLQVGGYCGGLTVPSSNVQEREVVFGGADRLREQLHNTLEVIDGKLFIVITGCVTEIIGDDIRAVVAEFREQGAPVICAETGGFKGNSYYGYDLILQALFRDFLTSDAPKVKRRVNLWGVVPYMDVFWRGNLEGLRTLLQKLGLEVNAFFTEEDSLEAIRQAAGAELNIVVSDLYGIEAAEVFQQIHGTPYLQTSLPIGPSASDAFLRKVGAALGLDPDLIEAVIHRENEVYYRLLDPLVDCYNDLDLQRYAVVVGDVNYTVALTRFIADDLGWLPELAVFTDPLSETEQARFTVEHFQLESGVKPQIIFETAGSEVLRHLRHSWPVNQGQPYFNAFSPAFVLGSSLERELAQTLGAAHLSISFPVANRAVLDRGYTGYRGGLRLIEDLLSAIVAGR